MENKKNLMTINMIIFALVIILSVISRLIPDYKDIKFIMIPIFYVYIYMTRVTYWWNIVYELLIVISFVLVIIGDDIFGRKVILADGAVLRYPVAWPLLLCIGLVAFYPVLSWIMKKRGYIILKSELEEYEEEDEEEEEYEE